MNIKKLNLLKNEAIAFSAKENPQSIKKFVETVVDNSTAKLFTPKETEELISKFNCLNRHTKFADEIQLSYYPKNGSIVLDNKYATNSTVEIYSDGSARSLGSWHNKEIAAAGTYSDVSAQMKARYETYKSRGTNNTSEKLNNDMDAMASLGKSNVFINPHKKDETLGQDLEDLFSSSL